MTTRLIRRHHLRQKMAAVKAAAGVEVEAVAEAVAERTAR
jgi:hypothetical protein